MKKVLLLTKSGSQYIVKGEGASATISGGKFGNAEYPLISHSPYMCGARFTAQYVGPSGSTGTINTSPIQKVFTA